MLIYEGSKFPAKHICAATKGKRLLLVMFSLQKGITSTAQKDTGSGPNVC